MLLNDSSSPASEKKLQLTLKAQDEIMKRILPALQAAVDEVVNFMVDPEDDAEVIDFLREEAVETTIDEMVRMLTRDVVAPSQLYSLRDEDGRMLETLIACYSELNPAKARRWYAQQLGITPEEHEQLLQKVPDQLQL